MNFNWMINVIVVFLNIYLAEECEVIPEHEGIKEFVINETFKIGEVIGKIPIKNPSDISCTPNEIKCHLNGDKTEVIVTLNKNVEHYPDYNPPDSDSKIELICRLRCESNEILKFILKIVDVNNNNPKFENSTYEFYVKELTPINSPVNSKPIIVSDYDFNLQTNAKITVSITEGDTEMFKLEKQLASNEIRKQYINIILKKRLNFRKKSRYKLTLTAKDHGEPPLSGTTNVIINILDDDDRDPEFEFFFYTLHLIIDKTEDGIVIKNNKTVGKILIGRSKKIQLNDIKPKVIHAFDPDIGINSSIYYELGRSDWTKYFEIDKEDGSIFLISFDSLLLEEQKINLPIEAYQTDFEEKKGHACLTVFFDANVSRPYFIHQIDILNKSLENDVIYKVNAFGEDITYAVNDNEFVDINANSGDIYLLQNATTLSETFSANFIVRTKFSHVYNNFEGHFRTVQREYKESLFKKSIYQIEISKHSQKEDYLFEIGSEISDKDIYLNLLGEDAQYFYIDTVKERIWIILSKSLPPERETFNVTVEAVKEVNGMVLERDYAELIFEVIEGHCQLKLFEKNIYIIQKNPEWKTGDIIYTLKSNIPYTQFYIQGENKFFAINTTTGDIALKTELDNCEKYELTIFGYAEDPRNDTTPPRNDTTQLVFISDVCIKKSRKFSKCVYTWNIESFRKSEPPSINLKDKEFTEDVSFSIISPSNINDNFKIDESGKLWMTKKLPAGQYFLKLQQKTNIKHTRSNEIPKIEDVGNNEALVIIDVEKSNIKEEKKPIFLHSNPLLKLFLPNAPLSDYSFEIKVFSSSNNNIKIKIKDESNSFAVDSETNQIFPIRDISKIERYQTVLTVKAVDFDDKPELNIYIYHVHVENCLNFSLLINSSIIFNKAEVERVMSSIFQNNSKEEITLHILKYSIKKSKNNFNNFEIIVTMLHNKTLLTFEEMRAKFEDDYIQQKIQNSFGSFTDKVSRYERLLKEIKNDKNENTFFIPAVVFGSLTIFIIILLLIIFIFSRFKKFKQTSQLIHSKFNGENIKYEEQENENQYVNVVEMRANQQDEVPGLNANEANVPNKSMTSYYNKAYDILNEVDCAAENKVCDINQCENQIKENEDQATLYENVKNINGNLNYIESKMENKATNNFENNQYNVEDDNENHYLHYTESERKDKSINYFKSDENNATGMNLENNQNTKESTDDLIIRVDVDDDDDDDLSKDENVRNNDKDLSKDENEKNDEDDDDTEDEVEFRSRTFSHRDSLTRLASFSEHLGNDSLDSDDESCEQNHKRSLVTFNDITEYIP